MTGSVVYNDDAERGLFVEADRVLSDHFFTNFCTAALTLSAT